MATIPPQSSCPSPLQIPHPSRAAAYHAASCLPDAKKGSYLLLRPCHRVLNPCAEISSTPLMRQLKSESLLGRIGLAAGVDRAGPLGPLSFEAARLMSKVAHLWRSLADHRLALLRNEALRLAGVRHLVSDDQDFVLALALAEITDELGSLARAVSRLSLRCSDPVLRRFGAAFADVAKTGADPVGFEYAERKMDRKVLKMEWFTSVATDLRREMETMLEKRTRQAHASANLRSKIGCQQQRVECLREASLWGRTFDYAVRLLSRSLFSVTGRIRQVFGDAYHLFDAGSIAVKRRALTPQCLHGLSRLPPCPPPSKQRNRSMIHPRFRPPNSPTNTLGAAAVALHYAKLILLIKKIAGGPHLIDAEGRHDLYAMLPWGLRAALRARLKRSKTESGAPSSVFDAERAMQWNAAMRRTLEWLAPLAHGTVRWFNERSVEHASSATRSSVLLAQTLHYADRRKAEEAITELLVGLDYLCRYGTELNARAEEKIDPSKQCDLI